MRASHLLHLGAFIALTSVAPLHAQSAGGLIGLSAPRGQAAKDAARAAVAKRDSTAIAAVLAEEADTVQAKADPAVAKRSFYLGSQVGYTFEDGGDFASNLIASGSILYSIIVNETADATKYRFFLPVRGNLASLNAPIDDDSKTKLSALLGSTGGMRVGIEPYVLFPAASPNLHPQVFASAGWVLTSAKDATDTTRFLPQGRFAVGAALGIGSAKEGAYPLWLEMSVTRSAFANQNFKKILGDTASSRAESFIATIIAPVSTHAALLTEVMATRNARPSWRLGLVITDNGK